jgi:hypothetical protein
MARRQLSDRDEGSTTLGAPRTRISQQGIATASLAAVAFLCYYATLLSGLDLGDSASFQTGVGFLTVSPRQAYPLYYALGNVFVWLHPGEPARAANLASAVYGAAAVGLAAALAARLSESLWAGVAAGLFLAFSYTFWSQAITAEVYTLHLMIVGACGLALLAWADRPTVAHLALFYAIYALGFGNHLSMVLLLPAFTVFLLMRRQRGPADPIQPRMVLMAVGMAVGGALQYAWNFRGLWADLEPPATVGEALAKFWFDVTKEDWRQTLVGTVSDVGLQHRPEMYWFDLQQQVGAPGVVLAVIGFCYVLSRWPSRAVLLVLIYAANMGFAWTYNVGDVYVFFLPSHYVVALCAGAGVAAITTFVLRVSNRPVATAAGAVLLLYPAWRGYDTYPAVDRSGDNRAVELLEQMTEPPRSTYLPSDPGDYVYALDSNWQVQNAVEYFMRVRKPQTQWFTTDQLVWLKEADGVDRFRRFVAANNAIGRSIVATDRTLNNVDANRATRILHEPLPHLLDFGARVHAVREGTAYALAVLRSDREYPLDTIALAQAWTWLAPGVMMPALANYTIIVGRVGERPVLIESQDRPYRVRIRLDPFDFDVRMESWLPTDTIRRAGFGHVIVNRQHALIVERGISFIALGHDGGPIYSSGPFARVGRQVLRP